MAAWIFVVGLVSFLALMGWIDDWVVIFVLMLVARTLFGVFGSATNPAAQAYVADRTSRDERMNELSTLTSGFTLGQMAGPAAAAVLITAGALVLPSGGRLATSRGVTYIAPVLSPLVLVRCPGTRARPPRSGGCCPPTTA